VRPQPGHLRVQVTDTGPGIAPEHFGLLFTPFERLGAEATDVEGTGIGLALSKRLVEAMNGAITVESTLGEGSTFTVTLPKATGLTAEEAISRQTV
jgi:signal transduction histidine kinase